MAEEMHNLSQIVAKIERHFNIDELQELCLLLGIDFQNLAGETKKAKARELAALYERRNNLPALMKALKDFRPKVNWESGGAFPEAWGRTLIPNTVPKAVFATVAIILFGFAVFFLISLMNNGQDNLSPDFDVTQTGTASTTPEVASESATTFASSTPPATMTPILLDALEPNDDFDEAVETVADVSQSLCNLTFYPQGDQDYFRWWGKAGTIYFISTYVVSAGIDTVLDVYDPNQSLIASNDDVAQGVFSSEVQFTAQEDGFYWVRVTNKSATDPSDRVYCLAVEIVIVPTATQPPDFPIDADLCEFNSTIETACQITIGDLISLNFVPTMGDEEDVDIFKLWIKPGSTYSCETFIYFGSNADTKITLWNADGRLFEPSIENVDKGNGVSLDYGSSVSYLSTYTGWLYIVVESIVDPPPRVDEAALHAYDLTCAAIEPPTTTPTPLIATPEP